jgi:type I restriction enzyme, S subunit
VTKYRNIFNLTNAGGTKKALNYSQIRDFDSSLLPLDLQKKSASIVNEVEVTKEPQKHLKEQINNIFNALMQKAVEGEIIQ